MTDDQRALFGRKIKDIEELKEATYFAKKKGQIGVRYEITKEVFLNDDEFKKFSKDFFKEQSWLKNSYGGSNQNGEIRCVRIVNTKTKEKILVNNEGYKYCRYTALEE